MGVRAGNVTITQCGKCGAGGTHSKPWNQTRSSEPGFWKSLTSSSLPLNSGFL